MKKTYRIGQSPLGEENVKHISPPSDIVLSKKRRSVGIDDFNIINISVGYAVYHDDCAFIGIISIYNEVGSLQQKANTAYFDAIKSHQIDVCSWLNCLSNKWRGDA